MRPYVLVTVDPADRDSPLMFLHGMLLALRGSFAIIPEPARPELGGDIIRRTAREALNRTVSLPFLNKPAVSLLRWHFPSRSGARAARRPHADHRISGAVAVPAEERGDDQVWIPGSSAIAS